MRSVAALLLAYDVPIMADDGQDVGPTQYENKNDRDARLASCVMMSVKMRAYWPAANSEHEHNY